jgi:hypothetical protein
MKRPFIYIIILVGLGLLGFVIASGIRNRPKELNERITLKKQDKIPYGTAAARDLLSSLFPGTPIFYSRQENFFKDSISRWGNNQAILIIADHFNADADELQGLIGFAKEGNHVFIISKSMSYETLNRGGFSYYDDSFDQMFRAKEDSLRIKLDPPFFSNNSLFVYPGQKHESYFTTLDTARTIVLGRTENGLPNFIQMQAGKGRIYFHTAPLAFSNYFILHKNNHEYFQQVVSVIPPDIDKILWSEYYLVKPRRSKQDDPGWLRVLMQYPAFKWGLLTGILTLLLYVLLNMRRRQRMIPDKVSPKNDSLDFIKTLGRLYYHRGDHMNLARKMGSHFLDHVRSRYKLGTVILDEDFTKQLHYKSGYPLTDVGELVDFINFLESAPAISDRQLVRFHQKLELFYQKT